MSHTYDVSANEYKLTDPPNDLIQSIKFGQIDSRHLLTASWDCKVRLYDINANQIRASYNHSGPVLDCSFQNNNWAWSGGADQALKRYDFQAQIGLVVGHHQDVIRCVEYVPDMNLIATGSWDRHLKLWDPRTADSSRSSSIHDAYLSEKVYSMGVCGDKLIIGTSERKIFIFDLRNMTKAQKESSLKYQIRCVKAFADQKGYIVSSIEGRVAVEYLDPSPEIQKQKYAFKCHRVKDTATGIESVYPVNTVSFHQRYNTFATGGSDGFVSIWDGKNKKRLVQFHKYPSSIPSLSFSQDGSILAIASSPMNTKEDIDQNECPPNTIYIRRINDHEVRNKN